MSLKQLHLLRHAKSDWDDPTLTDHDRPLAPRGRRAAPLVARYMQDQGLSFDLVLCSTARRAKQTASLIMPAIEGIPVIFERAIYGCDASALRDRLHTIDESVSSLLVIGHNPALEDMVIALCTPPSDSPSAPPLLFSSLTGKFPTAALATVSVDGRWADLGLPSMPPATLSRFIRPKDLVQQIS